MALSATIGGFILSWSDLFISRNQQQKKIQLKLKNQIERMIFPFVDEKLKPSTLQNTLTKSFDKLWVIFF